LKLSKYYENVDLKEHFRTFHRSFLPLFVLVSTVVLLIWVVIKPKRSVEKIIATRAGNSLVGLLNPALKEPFFDPAFAVISPIEIVTTPLSVRFDPPLGTEHAGLTYNAQPFLTTRHLGDDLNGIGGNDSDLGDPVYAVADGRVIYAGWPAEGWGNVAMVLHTLPDGRLVESFYGHLDKIAVFVGQRVRRGDRIGDVGNAGGKYLAHLHFELRTSPALDCGAGYGDSALDRLAGEFSLLKWRGPSDDILSPAPREAPDAEDGQAPLGVKTEK